MHERWISILILPSLWNFAFLFVFFFIQKSQIVGINYMIVNILEVPSKKRVNGKILGVQEVLYDSCLTFQISSFFFPIHKSAENNTWSWSCDCTPQVLVWAWRVTVYTTNSDNDIRNISSHRSQRTPVELGENKKNNEIRQKLCIQFQTVEFFSFTTFPNDYIYI